MDKLTLDKFRVSLINHRDVLQNWINADTNHSIRLGNATPEEVTNVLSELTRVINLMDNDEFGRCTICHEELEPERLAMDYTTCVCLDHYSKDQIRAIENDLELAAKVQRELMPCCIPELPGVQIAVHAKPARIVGGDYYDFFNGNSGGQGVAIADVMGKGLPASILMSNLQASLRILGPGYDEPHNLATRLNKLLRYNLNLIRFITLFLAKLDVNTRTIQYCNAGHNPPILWQAASRSIKKLNPTGPAIGLTHNPSYSMKTIRYNSGDLLFLYTDGLVEASNSYEEEFGEARLKKLADKHGHESADEFLDNILKTVKQFSGKFHDDVTLLVMKFQ